jgi:hypothetical protein
MNWKQDSLNLNRVKSKSKHIVYFESNEILEVESIEVSCGCTDAKYHPELKKLKVTITIPEIPIHLKSLRQMEIVKFITVHLKDGKYNTLFIKGIAYE